MLQPSRILRCLENRIVCSELGDKNITLLCQGDIENAPLIMNKILPGKKTKSSKIYYQNYDILGKLQYFRLIKHQIASDQNGFGHHN